MTYAVFQYDRKNEAENRIKSISLMLLLQESNLKGFDIAYSELNIRKLSSNNTEILVGYLCCREAKTNAVSILKFPTDLDTDEQLRVFGEDYLGCINVKVKKADLLERVEAIQLLDKNTYIKSWLTIRISDHLKGLKSVVHLNDDEIAELKAIEMKLKNPYEKWADARKVKLKKKVESYPKFLKRDF
jgi:hypothetical protein